MASGDLRRESPRTGMKTLVFNGWAAGPEAWRLCGFRHDWVFDYIEQLDGLPERVMADTDAALLVGFSMGGSTALRMLLRFPERIRGLVLVSATPRMMEERETGWKGMSERRLTALQLGTEMMFGDDGSPLYADGNLRRGLVYLHDTDLRPELMSLRERSPSLASLPVRIFQSERDGIVRPQNADFLRGLFPRARVTMVPGNEHVLPVTVPELIDEAVAELSS